MNQPDRQRQLVIFAEIALRQIFLEDPLLGMHVMAEPASADDFLADLFLQVTAALRAKGEATPLPQIHTLTARGMHDGYFAMVILIGEARVVGEAQMAALLVPVAAAKRAQDEGKPFELRPSGKELGARYFTLEIGEAARRDSLGHVICEWKSDARRIEHGAGPDDGSPESFIDGIIARIGPAS
jgi:hypothetical protein